MTFLMSAISRPGQRSGYARSVEHFARNKHIALHQQIKMSPTGPASVFSTGIIAMVAWPESARQILADDRLHASTCAFGITFNTA